MKRRTVAVLVVGSSAVIAAAAMPGDHLTIGPPSIQVTGGGSSSIVNAVNDGSNALMITGIDKDNCNLTDDPGITANFVDHPTNMFTMNQGSNENIVMFCPANGPSPTNHGIGRCKFFVKTDDTPEGRLDDATQICLYSSGTTALMAMPSTVSFGTVAVGGTMPGSFTLSTTMATDGVYMSILDDEGNFSFTTAPCSGPHCHDTMMLTPSTSRSVGLACTPQRTGTLDTDLYIIGDDGVTLAGPVRLECTGGTAADPDIDVPSTVILSQPVTGGPATTPMTLVNQGSGALVIDSMMSSGTDWSVQSISAPCATLPCTLPGGQMISVMLAFDPTAIGSTVETLTITSNDPDENPATVMLDGTGEGSTLNMLTAHGDPDYIGSTMPGGMVTQVYTLENAPATAGIMLTAGLTNTSDFMLDQTFDNVSPGGTSSFTVTCAPQTAGLKSTVLTFTADSTFGSPISFTVQCDGDQAPGDTLTSNPNPLDLGEVRIGSPPVVRTISLSSTGGTLPVTAGPSESPDLTNLTLGMVSPPDIIQTPPSTFNATFTPGTLEGVVTTTISVTAGGETETIPFSAKVVKIDLQEPDDIDFGTICVGKPGPEAQTLMLHEAGTATIRMLGQPEMVMMGSSPFTVQYVSPTAYPFDLLANESVTVSVQPKMQTVAARYEDDLEWPMDVVPATRTHVSVEFLDDKGGVTPGSVNFGSAPLRQTSETKMVTIQNCGAGTLTVSAPTFDRKEFVVVTAPPMSLAPSETAAVALAFIPEQVGLQTGKMTIPTSSGPLVVDLAGTGLGDGVPQGARASLYACSCSTGDPASALVIVLALTIPLIPRRRRG